MLMQVRAVDVNGGHCKLIARVKVGHEVCDQAT